ncbi:MAG: hypothetical protein R3C29_13760 [Dehalococcoidia bacterium]|nr:hypothetical protein [Dehalococcoidia bacterium]
MADSVAVRARCEACGRGLPFEEWQRGTTVCRTCSNVARHAPVAAPRQNIPLASDYRAYNQMVDEVPDELLDELLAALESEAQARRLSPPANPTRADNILKDVLDEIGAGRSQAEVPWAIWGFAGGFALNVLIAKYAQMATGVSIGEFLVPMVFGGVIAGLTCGAIGWGVARLREH